MVAAWAAAAGGRVEAGALRFPGDLPNGLALATLKTYARCVGLTVGEPLGRRCAWCPNDPMPGERLCEHCAWLSGRSLPPLPPLDRRPRF
jgi:hypothetical protein